MPSRDPRILSVWRGEEGRAWGEPGGEDRAGPWGPSGLGTAALTLFCGDRRQGKGFQWGVRGPGLHGGCCARPCCLHQKITGLQRTGGYGGAGHGAPPAEGQGRSGAPSELGSEAASEEGSWCGLEAPDTWARSFPQPRPTEHPDAGEASELVSLFFFLTKNVNYVNDCRYGWVQSLQGSHHLLSSASLCFAFKDSQKIHFMEKLLIAPSSQPTSNVKGKF